MNVDDQNDADTFEQTIRDGAPRAAVLEKVIVETAKGAPVVVASFLAGPLAGLAAKVTVEGLDELRKRLAEQSARDAAQRLADREPEIRAKHEQLVAAGYGSPADVRAIVESYIATWTVQSDARVRELIENVAVNAFDPKKYEEGITGRVFAVLTELDYPRISLLQECGRLFGKWREHRGRHPKQAADETWPDDILMQPWLRLGSLSAIHADDLLDRRLIGVVAMKRDVAPRRVLPTELGRAVLAHLVREAEAKAERDIDADIARGDKHA